MTNTTEIYAYDEMPYESYPYIQSSPEKLATLGLIFLNLVNPLATLKASFPETLITAKPDVPGAVAKANIDIKKRYDLVLI